MEKDNKEEIENLKKKNRKNWIKGLILGFFVISVIVIVIISNVSKGEEPIENCREIQVPYNVSGTIEQIEYYNETIPITTEECETEELPNKVENFVLDNIFCNDEDYICHKNLLGICTDKEWYCIDKYVSCSLDLYNLDEKKEGNWGVEFKFYDVGPNDLIRTKDTYIFLYPQTFKKVGGQIRIQSEGVDGDANKKIGCTYFLDTPTKEICEEVTRYEEVQREKIIVVPTYETKYRTETICD